MKSRRTFLQKLSAGIMLPTLGIHSALAAPTLMIDHTITGEKFWDQIRTQFPLTQNRTYLNNGTFGPAPFAVQKAMEESLQYINTSGEYGSTEPEREKLASFLEIKTSELSLTHNTTEGINIMAWGIALNQGDEVILTNHDHVGNALPWLNRAKLHGIVLKTFSPAATQAENLDLIKGLTSKKTRVIAIPHVTCTTGLVFPIKEIAEFAKKQGIITAIDGAHGAGSFDLNLEALGCDFYAGCCHKWLLGPSGTGFLYVREQMIDQLQTFHVGGGSDAGWDLFTTPPVLNGYVATAHRFDYGTQSTTLMKGVSAATTFHHGIGKEKVEIRVRELNQYLFEGISDLNSQLEILSPEEAASRISMVSFRPKNISYQELGDKLGQEGFRIRQVAEGKVDAIRVSTHIYNSKKEIDLFLKALAKQVG